MNTPEHGEYCAREIDAYQDAWYQAINSSVPNDVMVAIPARLLHRWLGSRIHDFTAQVAGRRSDIINPVLVTQVASDHDGLRRILEAVQG